MNALDLDGAVLAHPPEVVAAEVDEHHVLGALLLVGEQLRGDAAVGLGVVAARARARDRARGDAAARDGQQRLRAGAGDLEVLEVEEVHVRRRVDRAQAAVDRERLDRHRRRPALGRHDLEAVAGVDVLDDPGDHRLELLARHVRLERSASCAGPACGGAGAAPGRPGARAPRRSCRGRLVGPWARTVTVCLRWSKATSTSESISAMSGRPSDVGVGLAAAARPCARSRSRRSPTAPPVNGGAGAAAAPGVARRPRRRRARRGRRRPRATSARPCAARKPMNDQRPTRVPCSADSSRKAGPAPRSFRKAETGVSQSSMKRLGDRDERALSGDGH